jgi:hypothetical protein
MERIKMTYAERLRLAKVMTAYAKEHLAEGLETWKGEDDMIEMTRADCKDYREIGRLLREVGAEAAFELARSLDTAAREYIPDEVWSAMEADEEYREYTEEDEREVVVYRIGRYRDEIAALQVKLREAQNHLRRIDA